MRHTRAYHSSRLGKRGKTKQRKTRKQKGRGRTRRANRMRGG